jgi:hypothetical protein
MMGEGYHRPAWGATRILRLTGSLDYARDFGSGLRHPLNASTSTSVDSRANQLAPLRMTTFTSEESLEPDCLQAEGVKLRSRRFAVPLHCR